jgi:hypothetical protein
MGSPAQRLESERAKYPAMQVDEILVWREWLKAHQSQYTNFDYNVYIGIALDPGPAYSPEIRKMAIALRQKRVDAVGYQGNTPTLFEVKRRAGPENIGQVLVYAHYWPITFPQTPTPQLAIVAADADPHLPDVLAKFSIRLDLVAGVDFSVLSPKSTATSPQ